jgi:hypothetical protein
MAAAAILARAACPWLLSSHPPRAHPSCAAQRRPAPTPPPRGPHSVFGRPSTLSLVGHPLGLCVPHSASARPSVAAIHCCTPNPQSTIAATACTTTTTAAPPGEDHRRRDIVSRSQLKTPRQGRTHMLQMHVSSVSYVSEVCCNCFILM